MRSIFFIAFILLGQLIIAQPYNQTDSQGRKIGKWKKVYSNGKIRYQGQFDKDVPQGVFKYYNTNGQLTSILTYSKDGKSSECKMYYVKGQLRATGYYYEKKKDSTWLYYSEIKQIVIAEENYRKGVKHGAWRIYFSDGSLASEVFWKNGIKDGKWTEYFRNGKKRLETTYKNDLLDGDYVLYSINNTPLKKGVYINGKQDGIWVTFDDLGHKTKINYFKMGWLYKEEFYANEVLIKTIEHGGKLNKK